MMSEVTLIISFLGDDKFRRFADKKLADDTCKFYGISNQAKKMLFFMTKIGAKLKQNQIAEITFYFNEDELKLKGYKISKTKDYLEIDFSNRLN